MKLIDFNCGIGAPFKSERYTTAEGLLHWMDEYRISRALCYHSEAMREPEMGNGLMIEECRKSSGRLALCFATNPTLVTLGIPGQGAPEQRIKAAKPSALRVFPEEQDYLFSSFYAESILSVAEKLHLPIVVDMKYTQNFLTELPKTCMDFPNVPIILPRFGFRKSQYIFPLLQKLPNLYLDVSMMVDVAQIEEIVERFGSEHLLYGSGLPNYVPDGGLGLLMYAQIPDRDRQNVLHANFERLEGGILYDD